MLAAVALVDLATLAAAAALVDGAPGLLVAVAALVTAVALAWTAWTTAVAVQVIRRRAADWHADPGELGRVRARRPHAAEADPDLLHDEFAVAVEDGGALVLWRFAPLLATATAPPGTQLVRGTPCYAAAAVQRTPCAPAGTARAAERLAAAQQAAAEREAAAAGAVRAGLYRHDDADAIPAGA
jgi:hypothetical protein